MDNVIQKGVNKIESVTKKIKLACVQKDTNVTQLAAKLELSKENFHAQLKRDNFRTNDIEKIAGTLGYDVEVNFIDKETKDKI